MKDATAYCTLEKEVYIIKISVALKPRGADFILFCFQKHIEFLNRSEVSFRMLHFEKKNPLMITPLKVE